MGSPGKVWMGGGTPGVVKGPAASGSVADCSPDTNDLVWLTHDTLAGAAEVNIQFTINPPKRKFYYIGKAAESAGQLWVSLEPQDPNIVSGGVLITQPVNAFRLVPYDTVGNVNTFAVEFCKPISKIFMTHPDFGVGQVLQFLATDDVVLAFQD